MAGLEIKALVALLEIDHGAQGDKAVEAVNLEHAYLDLVTHMEGILDARHLKALVAHIALGELGVRK